jgi:CopG family nickel-responsive transcriptional regulator
MVVVSITVPGSLLDEFDSFIRNRGYYSRSEAFRDALRSLMSESQLVEKESGRVAATIVVRYECSKKDVTTRLIRLTCNRDVDVIESLHRRLDNNQCLSVFVAEGTVQRIRNLAGRIRGMRGIEQVETVLIPMQKRRLA